MDWLDKLERRFRFIGIPGLLPLVTGLQAAVFALSFKDPGLPQALALIPEAVFAGQWWRCLTFILAPLPFGGGMLGILFAVFYYQLFWMMGRALEAEWGAFRVTAYALGGVLFQNLAALLSWRLLGLPLGYDGFYWSLSVQLAFAAIYPDFEILIMFILPMKMRMLAWITGALLLWGLLRGGAPALLLLGGAFANYLVFFAPGAWQGWRSRRQSALQRRGMRQNAEKALAALPAKRCAQCGKGAREADVRLCTCGKCGEDGRFWCVEDLRGHLGKS